MDNKVNHTPQPSKEWQELNQRFIDLCYEQDKLNRKEFETVFETLYQIDNSQREIYNTNGWNMGIDLPDEADTAKIQQALEQAGFSKDEVFCNDFTRYANVVIEGKKNMQKRATINLKSEMDRCKPDNNPDEWQFYPISIIAPQEFIPIIDNIIDEDAKTGKGLFANVTDIEKEDEDLDELLMIEAFGLKCSLVPFLDELKQYNVAGVFMNKEFTHLLFKVLNGEATFIKDNTDAPAKVKNHISDTIKQFDKMPIWGLFFQILILQGLCTWFEGININEGDNGYNEAQSLLKWIIEQLIKKEIVFCFKMYGDEDKKILKPLTDYLYSTEIGQAVQNHIFNKKQLENSDKTTNELPKELQSERAQELFNKAIKAGFITMQKNTYEWNFEDYTGQLLAYFCDKASHYLNLSKRTDRDGNPTVSWKVFEKAFDVKNIISYKNNWMKVNTKFTPNGYEKIDKLFD